MMQICVQSLYLIHSSDPNQLKNENFKNVNFLEFRKSKFYKNAYKLHLQDARAAVLLVGVDPHHIRDVVYILAHSLGVSCFSSAVL